MTEVEKIILKNFKPKKGDATKSAGYDCRRELIELKNTKIIKTRESKKYQEVSKMQQMVLCEKAVENINNEIDYFFLVGDTYRWEKGNENLKKLIS